MKFLNLLGTLTMLAGFATNFADDGIEEPRPSQNVFIKHVKIKVEDIVNPLEDHHHKEKVDTYTSERLSVIDELNPIDFVLFSSSIIPIDSGLIPEPKRESRLPGFNPQQQSKGELRLPNFILRLKGKSPQY